MGYKKDCFAYTETTKGDSKCSCLININCDGCSFYNNIVKRADLERQVEAYRKAHKDN